MPVTSVSGTLSTSIYFVSMFLLLGILLPPTRTVYQDASLESAKHLAAGLAGQIDDLSPGMTSTIRFGSFPGVATSVSLSGETVTATVDGTSASARVMWQMQSSVLFPDREYVVGLNGGVLKVA